MDTPTAAPSAQKPHVLLVEDNETYRNAVRVALEAYGFDVTEAPEGKTGIAKMQTLMPSVVVSDIYMPEMDGITLLTEVKKNPEWAHIPFIMLTNVQEEIDHSVKLGADEAVFKASVTPKQIVDICLQHLNKSNQ